MFQSSVNGNDKMRISEMQEYWVKKLNVLLDIIRSPFD